MILMFCCNRKQALSKNLQNYLLHWGNSGWAAPDSEVRFQGLGGTASAIFQMRTAAQHCRRLPLGCLPNSCNKISPCEKLYQLVQNHNGELLGLRRSEPFCRHCHCKIVCEDKMKSKDEKTSTQEKMKGTTCQHVNMDCQVQLTSEEGTPANSFG